MFRVVPGTLGTPNSLEILRILIQVLYLLSLLPFYPAPRPAFLRTEDSSWQWEVVTLNMR